MVTIYKVTDAAAPGYQPQEQLVKLAALCYENRRVGVARYYDAKQANTEVKRVLRVQHTTTEITPQNKVRLNGHVDSEDGKPTVDVDMLEVLN